MYSPKIREDLIPQIYRAAKKAGLAMTKWVNQVIEQALPSDTEENDQETSERSFRKERRRYDRFRTGTEKSKSGE
jgi:hypothetical protein